MPNANPTAEQIADAFLARLLTRTKAVSSTPTTIYGHGTGGLFSAPGVDREIYNAMQLPISGIESLLPQFPTTMTVPTYDIVTGQTASSGSEPSGACDDWPEAGLTKLCGYQTTMSRAGRSSRVFDITRVGEQVNNADMMDYVLVGDPLAGATDASYIPTGFGDGNSSAFLNNELAKAMRELRIAYIRDFSRDLYTANPANNVGVGRKYYKGLDMLVNTGYADYETTTVCPAADPIVRSFSSIDINVAPTQFVQELVSIYRELNIIAEETGMQTVTWALAMPRSLFYKITAIWPCAYYTDSCPLPIGAQQYYSATEQTDMRDKMRTGNYLLFDGKPVNVVQDVSITTTALAGLDTGSYTSSIYFLPLKVMGNKPSLYKQFFNFNAPGAAMDFVKAFKLTGTFNTTDNGKFLWLFKPPTNYCVQMQVIARETLVLRTPFLSARLTNVRWTPLHMERSPFPGDATYVNGGKTSRL